MKKLKKLFYAMFAIAFIFSTLTPIQAKADYQSQTEVPNISYAIHTMHGNHIVPVFSRWYRNGETAGYEKASLNPISFYNYAMDKIKIKSNTSGVSVAYQVYIKGKGWSRTYYDGEEAGESCKQINDIKVWINSGASDYRVVYQTCNQGTSSNIWSNETVVKNKYTNSETNASSALIAFKLKIEQTPHAIMVLGSNLSGTGVDSANECFGNYGFITHKLITPTVSSLISTINDVAKSSNENSVTYIYIYAHGNKNNSNDFYFRLNEIPKEINTYYFKYLISKLDAIKGRKVIFLNSCYSGAAILNNGEAPSQLGSNYRDYQVLCASQYNRTSHQGTDGNGIVTPAWLSGIGYDYSSKLPCDFLSDSNNDGLVTLNELYNYTESYMHKNSHGGIDAVTTCYPENENDTARPVMKKYLYK